jgi:hypothetical protein
LKQITVNNSILLEINLLKFSCVYYKMPNLKILTILTIIVLILYITNFYILTENFDAKITGGDTTKCGIACTKLINCKGFMVGSDGTCYLSKTPILGQPTNSVFANEYNNKTPICNKFKTFSDTQISELDKKKNATFICVPNQKDSQQTYKIYDNKEKQIYSLEDLENINVDPYTFVDIDWNKQLKLEDYPKLIENPNPDDKNNIVLLSQYTDEYLGQYMFPHKCVANISQLDCIKFCLNNEDCAGTEWNPVYTPVVSQTSDDTSAYELHNGVCCPKRKIIKNIPRRKEFEHGRFYLKEQLSLDDLHDNALVNLGK